ncbi:hypothetical protein GGX14DRAFT_679001 [Mycena pura]|uniref:Uncharacterized protein n=1 Tax=Mycena pura TaxID=153505 RepID=A0AAD6UXH8_9AGAR|nr:hypothetical protein GGX14DRAFT_679001 [Mycena pura]
MTRLSSACTTFSKSRGVYKHTRSVTPAVPHTSVHVAALPAPQLRAPLHYRCTLPPCRPAAYAAFVREFAMKIAYAADVLGPHFPALPGGAGAMYMMLPIPLDFWGVSIALRSTFIRDLKIYRKWDHQACLERNLGGARLCVFNPTHRLSPAASARIVLPALTLPMPTPEPVARTRGKQHPPPIAGASHVPAGRVRFPLRSLHAARLPLPAPRSLPATRHPLPAAHWSPVLSRFRSPHAPASQFSTLPATYTHAKTFRSSTYEHSLEHSLPRRSSATAVANSQLTVARRLGRGYDFFRSLRGCGRWLCIYRTPWEGPQPRPLSLWSAG